MCPGLLLRRSVYTCVLFCVTNRCLFGVQRWLENRHIFHVISVLFTYSSSCSTERVLQISSVSSTDPELRSQADDVTDRQETVSQGFWGVMFPWRSRVLVYGWHRHDRSNTSQLSWYRDRMHTSASHCQHYALRHGPRFNCITLEAM